MGLIVDTCIFILAERGKGISLSALLAIEEPLGLSAITLCELLIGSNLSTIPARAAERKQMAEAIASVLPVYPYTADIARIHAPIVATLMRTGNIIGGNDSIIAATAIAHGMGVMTTNVDEFSRIEGLRIVEVPR